MDDKEKWDAAVALFGSLEKDGDFLQLRVNNLHLKWRVASVIYESGHRKLRATVPSNLGGGSVVWTLGEFNSLNCVAYSPPEPVKSEAEKLFETLGDGDTFWTTGNCSAYIRWTFVSRGPLKIVARHDLGDLRGMTYSFDASRLSDHHATATRPKTEREEVLEGDVRLADRTIEELLSEVKQLEDTLGGTESALKQVGDRHAEAKGRVTEQARIIKELEKMHDDAINAVAGVSVEVTRILKQARR